VINLALDNDYILAELCCLDVGGHTSLWAWKPSRYLKR
jgi:hypothetical protein